MFHFSFESLLYLLNTPKHYDKPPFTLFHNVMQLNFMYNNEKFKLWEQRTPKYAKIFIWKYSCTFCIFFNKILPHVNTLRHSPIFGRGPPSMSLGWLDLTAFMRLFWAAACPPGALWGGPGIRGPLVGSTGSTRRLFFGSFARAWEKQRRWQPRRSLRLLSLLLIWF